jgi:hypothetical protein
MLCNARISAAVNLPLVLLQPHGLLLLLLLLLSNAALLPAADCSVWAGGGGEDWYH